LADSLETVADHIYRTLAFHFPVCLSSDEFHFFPQYISPDRDWSRWDDFSPESVGAVLEMMAEWLKCLDARRAAASLPEERVDLGMLTGMLGTLWEQLDWGGGHKSQPTFYLTVAGIGLAEALEAGDEPFRRRMATLPVLLDAAARNLPSPPRLFRDMGLRMARKLKIWVRSLAAIGGPAIAGALDALDRFIRHLDTIPVTEAFRLSEEQYARIAERHIGCRMDVAAIAGQLEAEIDGCRQELETEAGRLSPGRRWQDVVKDLPAPGRSEGRHNALYQLVISDLRSHCVQEGLTTRRLANACVVSIRDIPSYLRLLRSGAAFSMPPGHPPKGGTFFLMPEAPSVSLPADYRLLAAHETFPGHHLLDANRWALQRPLRRPVEYPLFYEGWASFSEELLFDTGFFSGPVDRLLMAKRRFWRAVRGRTDLDIHTGWRSPDSAVAALVHEGLPVTKAVAMVQRYALKPGYQLSYTIGRRRFRELFESFIRAGGRRDGFVRGIMAEGEIDWDDLSGILLSKGDDS
jgi:hypothetical protein